MYRTMLTGTEDWPTPPRRRWKHWPSRIDRSFWPWGSSNRTCPSTLRNATGTCTTARNWLWPVTRTRQRAYRRSPCTRSANCGPTGVFQKQARSPSRKRELVHGYYACVSFVDAQIGRVLDTLDRMGLSENTIVIVWGDHGWHLGDHGLWCKHTNFESATHVPMIVRVPGAPSAGQTCDALTEYVDIYPSLCELAGIPVPGHVEGSSFAPLINDPRQAWKQAAFSQYPRGGSVMGYSMRTSRYRYTQWIRAGGTLEAVELYDHQNDSQENHNLAVRAEHQDLLQKLNQQLQHGCAPHGPQSRNDA